jgi:transcription antitermination factor NusG
MPRCRFRLFGNPRAVREPFRKPALFSSKMQHGGARANSGGARPNSGGARPNSGPRRIVYLERPDAARWYCARTRYGCEQDAAAEILSQGFEVFAPSIWKPATRARRNAAGAMIPAREASFGPLFRTYIFARFRLADYWQARSRVPSVEAILGLAPDAPTPLPDRAVELIRGMCDADGCFHEDGEAPNSLVGSLVRMTEGPMDRFEGVCDWSDGQRVRVLLSLLGRDNPVTVPTAWVEPV